MTVILRIDPFSVSFLSARESLQSKQYLDVADIVYQSLGANLDKNCNFQRPNIFLKHNFTVRNAYSNL